MFFLSTRRFSFFDDTRIPQSLVLFYPVLALKVDGSNSRF